MREVAHTPPVGRGKKLKGSLSRAAVLLIAGLPVSPATAWAQSNRTLTANELETVRLGFYLKTAAESCGYKLRYNPIKSIIYPGSSLLDVVRPGSKKDLTDIAMEETTKFASVPKPNACSTAWNDYGPRPRKGLWALVSAD